MKKTKSTKQRTIIARKVAYQAFLGFVLGFFLLHPISMVIFLWLDPCFANGMPDVARNTTLATAMYAFDPSMFPMGLAYGFLASLITAVSGYFRATICNQRDVLRIQHERLAKLECTNRRNTQFMVHDLKTHVGCILGFTDLLLDQKELLRTPENVDALHRIRRQALEIKGCIDELLDLARIHGTGKLQREVISPVELLQAVVEVFSPFPEGRVVLTGSTVIECPSFWGEEHLLRRVLINLVANSLKHNRGNVRVLLNAEYRNGGAELQFTCIDNGSGIPSEALDSVFEEFETNAGEKNESSGLGLAFCKVAVEAHGGRIWCESDGKNGASFYFTVPENRKELKDD